jgi:hypothetical protein
MKNATTSKNSPSKPVLVKKKNKGGQSKKITRHGKG